MQTAAKPTLAQLAAAIRSALSDVENAQDEVSATGAFARLKMLVEAQLSRSEELREDYYRQRNTIQRQAHELTDAASELAAGERAPSAPDELPTVHIQIPEVLTVETAPNCLFVRLSFGLVNLLQIALLDIQARTLYLTSGNVRTLEPADFYRLAFHCQHYQPSTFAASNDEQISPHL
ncbi:MAG: hypothetical protein AAB316_00780 [Bacteroidota bacterium]